MFKEPHTQPNPIAPVDAMFPVFRCWDADGFSIIHYYLFSGPKYQVICILLDVIISNKQVYSTPRPRLLFTLS
jgi:hypothetical protein